MDITESELSEDILMQDLLYVFQGINGKFICMKKSADGFRLSDGVRRH